MSKQVLVIVELDELPKSLIAVFQKATSHVIWVKKQVLPLRDQDMTIILGTDVPRSTANQGHNDEGLAFSRPTPWLVLRSLEQLNVFCMTMAHVDTQDAHIRDTILEIYIFDPRDVSKDALRLRHELLLGAIRASCWGFPNVAIHGCSGTNIMQFVLAIQGERWTSKDDFFRALMTLVYVKAPRLVEERKYVHAITTCLNESRSLPLATSLTSFGKALRQDFKSREQINKLCFSLHRVAAEAAVTLLTESFEHACQGDGTNNMVVKARFVRFCFHYADSARAIVNAAFQTLNTFRMPTKQLSKWKGELYCYQCEALTMLCNFEDAKKALQASVEAVAGAGSIAVRMHDWRAKWEKLHLLSEELRTSLFNDAPTMEEISNLLASTANMKI